MFTHVFYTFKMVYSTHIEFILRAYYYYIFFIFLALFQCWFGFCFSFTEGAIIALICLQVDRDELRHGRRLDQ